MQINIGSYVVRNGSTIDHEATIAKFKWDLLKFQAEKELEETTIGEAVHAYFDKHLGKRLNSKMVVGDVLVALNVQPENFSVLHDKVTEFFRTSPEFNTARGKGGGVARVCDITSK